MRKVVFMGTPVTSCHSLAEIIEAGFEVTHVLTQADKPRGRGGKLSYPPVKELALRHNIEVLQPETLKNNKEVLDTLTAAAPDFFAVVAYGKILPKEFLNVPRIAPVNLHFSLLPLYRGSAPVNYAVLNGDEYTGSATIKMNDGMDTGDILLMEKTPIGRKNAHELLNELAQSGAKQLVKTLWEYENITPKPQEGAVSKAPMLSKIMGKIDWGEPAVIIERKIRAFIPWPCAYTEYNGKILKIFAGDIEEAEAEAGKVYKVAKDYFSIGTGRGGLRVKVLQIEGKRCMGSKDFLAGSRMAVGEQML